MHKIPQEFINTIEHTLSHKVNNLAINKWTRTTTNRRDKLFQLVAIKMYEIIRSQIVVVVWDILV